MHVIAPTLLANAIIFFHSSKLIFCLSSISDNCFNTAPTNASPAPVESTCLISIDGIILFSPLTLKYVPLDPKVIVTTLTPNSCNLLTPVVISFSPVNKNNSSSLNLVKSLCSYEINTIFNK